METHAQCGSTLCIIETQVVCGEVGHVAEKLVEWAVRKAFVVGRVASRILIDADQRTHDPFGLIWEK